MRKKLQFTDCKKVTEIFVEKFLLYDNIKSADDCQPLNTIGVS
jgi:hypothetical protein